MSVPVQVRHDRGCHYARENRGGHEDAAGRVADTWNLHLVAGRGLGLSNVGRWFAAALADGRGDGVLYDSRADAVRHQHHNEQYYMFLRLVPSEMTVCQAASLLRTHRLAYDAGFRMTDPDARGGGYELIPALTLEDSAAQLAALARRTLPTGRYLT